MKKNIGNRLFATKSRNIRESNLIMTDTYRTGYGGRIEEAFASAKAKGEAAFVTFVTAGYPRAEGK